MRGIYKITNKINGKVYIGETLNLERRWKEHLKDLALKEHCNYKLQADFNKYGYKAFEFEVLATLDNDISNFVDKFINLIFEDVFIAEYNSIEEGYNIERTLEKVLSGERNVVGNGKGRAILRGFVKRYENGLIFIQDNIIYYQTKKKNNKAKRLYLSNLPTIQEVVVEELKLDIKPKELKQLLCDNGVLVNGVVQKRYKDYFIILKNKDKRIIKITPKGKKTTTIFNN